jgi:cbb3-type cytochrome oxidase maturation protein
MEIMILLIPITLAITAVATGFLLWAIDDGQYDDAERDATEALFDDPGSKN